MAEGAASLKMLGWESHLEEDHVQIRRDEANPLMTLQLITASIGAVSVFCVPVACVVTFGTAVAMGKVRDQRVCWSSCTTKYASVEVDKSFAEYKVYVLKRCFLYLKRDTS